MNPGEKSGVNAPVPAPANPAWSVVKQLPSSLLFRYSAVTWNAHRIHYDADYTRGEEGYPDVVQNGGLTMQLLLDAVVAHTPGVLRAFNARLTRPIHVNETITLAGHAPVDGVAHAWVANAQGAVCGLVEARFG